MQKNRLFFYLLGIILLFSLASISASSFGYDNPNLPKLSNPNALTGNFSWNGNCSSGGVEIRNDGTICGQRLEVFNITSVNVTQQNLTVIDNLNILGNTSSFWFFGLFNWTTSDVYNSFNGSHLLFNETKLNDTIDNALATLTVEYNATSIANITGTRDAGDVNSTHICSENDFYNVSEVTGANGLQIQVNFSDVIAFNLLHFRGQYIGGAGHSIELEFWNPTSSAWEKVNGELTDQSEQTSTSINIFGGSSYIDNGNVSFRFNHDDNGITSHDYILDCIHIAQQAGVSFGGDHDALTGRDDCATNHPDAMCVNGSIRSMTASLNLGTNNITNTSYGFFDFGNFTNNVEIGENLTCDTDTFIVNSNENMVGIGINPTTRLQIKSLSTSTDVIKVDASDGSTLFDVTESSGGDGRLDVADNTGATKISINTGGDSYFTGDLCVGCTSTTRNLKVQRTGTGAVAEFEGDNDVVTGPTVIFNHDSNSPAKNDVWGFIWDGRDSGGASQRYAQSLAGILDPIAGQEAGFLDFRLMVPNPSPSNPTPMFKIEGINRYTALGWIGTVYDPEASLDLVGNSSHGDYFRISSERDLDGDVMIVDSSGNVGINISTPTYPLEVNANVTNISIWALARVSALGYDTRTSVFDKSKSVWDYVKDADYYKENGEIVHDRFYGYTGEFEVIDKDRPEQELTCSNKTIDEIYTHTEEVCEYQKKQLSNNYERVCTNVSEQRMGEKQTCSTETVCDYIYQDKTNDYEQSCYEEEVCEPIFEEVCSSKTIYPYTKMEGHVGLEMEVDILRQAVYELKQENQDQDNIISSMKQSLCKLGEVIHC
jgi:hypothetical protein